MNERTARALDFPADVVFDLPVIRIEGTGWLRCENHKGLLEYTSECVRLAAAGMTVRITGSGLVIGRFGAGDMTVTGSISAVELIPVPSVRRRTADSNSVFGDKY